MIKKRALQIGSLLQKRDLQHQARVHVRHPPQGAGHFSQNSHYLWGSFAEKDQ